MYFESFVCGPDKFILSSYFLFQLMEKVFFMRLLFYFLFFLVLFFIHCEYGIGLKVDVPSKSTS